MGSGKDCKWWRVALKGNADRGVNRALSMENLYGTADHLVFRSEEHAEGIVKALAEAGVKAHVVPPTKVVGDEGSAESDDSNQQRSK